MSDEKKQTNADSPQPKPDNIGEVEVVEVEVVGRRRRDGVEIRVPAGIAVRTAGDRDGTRIVLLGFVGDERQGSHGATQTKASDNETLEKPGRRRFTAAFKQAILQKTDTAEPGEIGAILRKRSGCCEKASARTRPRVAANCSALPWWTAEGVKKARPL